MRLPADNDHAPLAAHVSTGQLPPTDEVQRRVDEAHARYAADERGEPSAVYPALARVTAGSSVRGQLVAAFLSARLGMDVVISAHDDEATHDHAAVEPPG